MATRHTETGAFLISHLTSNEFVNMFRRQKGRKKFYIFDGKGPKRVNKAEWWHRAGRSTVVIYEDAVPGFTTTTHLRTIAPGKRQATPFNHFIVFRFAFDGRHERRMVTTHDEAVRVHDEFVEGAKAINKQRLNDFLALGELALPLDDTNVYAEGHDPMIDWLKEHCPLAKLVRFEFVGFYCAFPTIQDAMVFKMVWGDFVRPSSGIFTRP